MKLFASIQDNVVINTIVADNQETAEAITGLPCIEFTKETGLGVGFKLVDGVWQKQLVENNVE